MSYLKDLFEKSKSIKVEEKVNGYPVDFLPDDHIDADTLSKYGCSKAEPLDIEAIKKIALDPNRKPSFVVDSIAHL